MPVSRYFGFLAPLFALLLGFGVDAIPRITPFLVGLFIVSMATVRPNPLIYDQPRDHRSVVAAIRRRCSDCIIVVGAGGGGRGVPGSVLYEAHGIPVLALDRRSAASVFGRAGKFRSVYFIPSNERNAPQIEQEFIEMLKLRPASGYFVAVPDK
jgi:hypothetical protein